jgi:fatty acid desaturase
VADADIRNRLNIALVALVQIAAWLLLWAGARVSGAWVFAVGVVYSFLLLTNYALIHEATHDNLNADARWNRWLGVLAGCLFPIPFSMIKVTHTVHHCCNRTDHEMFDLYYPGDNMVLKLGQWYGLLSGFFWPCIPVGMVIPGAVPTAAAHRTLSQGAHHGRVVR